MNISKTLTNLVIVSLVSSAAFSQKGRSGGSSKSSSGLLGSEKSSRGNLFGGKDVSVSGYTKKDGTYVAPHMRSSKDNDFYNNWSTKGNYNPYTLKEGTKTSPSYPSYGGYPSYNGIDYNGYNYRSSLSTSKYSKTPADEKQVTIDYLLNQIKLLTRKIEELENKLSANTNNNFLTNVYFSLGSSKKTVLEVMGKPTNVTDVYKDGSLIWFDYKKSRVTIENDVVIMYDNDSKNLKVR